MTSRARAEGGGRGGGGLREGVKPNANEMNMQLK